MMRSLLPILGMLPATLAQTSGTFNAMTFNVAGLPEILNGNDVPGDKDTNTARIGQLFTQYGIDMINVQEDFNFHATLYANDNHPYRTPTSGGVPFGSGLNTLSNFSFEEFERVKWNVCSNFDSADCLTPKGFTFMRVSIAPGVFLDAYNLHADAGGSDADNTARAANIKQVSDFIKVRSVGNPVLIFGDSNTRYTRAEDNPWLFAQENGMKDSWVELIRGGNPPAGGSDALLCDNPSKVNTCETVDKFWYRGSPAVKLQAREWKYASTMFLQENGDILSDHNPVLVDFDWSVGELLRVSETWGGPHGDWFNDLDAVAALTRPAASSITLRGADRLDAVQITLTSGQTFTHGGSGGSASTLRLNAGERITGGTLCSAQRSGRTRIFFAELRTSAGRSLAKGVRTDSCVERNAPDGFGVVGFLGRSGDEVDQLGFVFGKA